MIAQPQQMELDTIRERIPTITITTRKWSLNYAAQNKTVDIYNITVRANGKIISVRNPAEWYFNEGKESNDGGISYFFTTDYVRTWTEGDNIITYDELFEMMSLEDVLYQATDAFNTSTYIPEKISVKLSDFGLVKSGDTINIQYSVTVETV